MARLSASLLAVFLCLAVSSSALPANPDAAQPSPSNANTEASSSKVAYEVLKSATNMMGTMKDANANEKHGVEEKPATRDSPQEDKDTKASPTKDEKASATDSATSTSSPTSTSNNLLSDLPVLGPLLSGGGGKGSG
ncbi:hypothetical protein PHISCL_02152 [Aspergillus sclerotialis]|uniref:Uncharacterized protein n=1 Tax=Aspergillus sclerotialis TaxID=2070753 RepID=A0A3A2ZS59_9EURO|nr:hypothetical protein PHISCL_02152 [Aspergillus sclerotialis]